MTGIIKTITQILILMCVWDFGLFALQTLACDQCKARATSTFLALFQTLLIAINLTNKDGLLDHFLRISIDRGHLCSYFVSFTIRAWST